MKRISVANTCNMADESIRYLEQYALELNMDMTMKHPVDYSEDDCIQMLKGYPAAIVGGSEALTERVFASLKDTLQVICRLGVGYENIDIEGARRQGIAVANAAGGNAAAVADHTVMLMMALSRQICLFNTEVRAGIWNQPRVSVQIAHKTVGIVGFGRIGRIVAQYLSGFSCKVLAHDDAVNDSVFEAQHAERVSLSALAERSDYVTLHVPATPLTQGMIDRAFLARMKPTAYLINTARGALIDEQALTNALENRVIAGAGLDVFANEPLAADHPLCKMDHVILSPHVSYNTDTANNLTAKITAQAIYDFFTKGTSPNIIN